MSDEFPWEYGDSQIIIPLLTPIEAVSLIRRGVELSLQRTGFANNVGKGYI